MTMNRYELLEKLQDIEADAHTARGKYLSATGWTYTSETPGSYWLWRKTLPSGVTILMGVKEALNLQAHLDDEEEPRPAESEGCLNGNDA